MKKQVTPCLWFDTQAEDAATFYCSIFPNSRITETSYFGDAGPRSAGMVLTVGFELDGRQFTALNGGPEFKFSEATSLQIFCDTQDEVDMMQDPDKAKAKRATEAMMKMEKIDIATVEGAARA